MEDLEYKCKICGRTEFVNHYEWVSHNRCYDCKRINSAEVLPREIWGQICELYANGKSPHQIMQITKVHTIQVNYIIRKYEGVGEQPVLMTIS